ncbi:hypothetical protein FA13DRAFT_1597683, partial [Coprinellus micaceus]
CVCGKRFHQVNAYSNHINGCKKYKNGVGASLELAKARYAARKSKKGKERQTLGSYLDDDLDVDHVEPPSDHDHPQAMDIDPPQVDPPFAEYGRGHRAYVPIARYTDFTATSTIPFNIPSMPPEEDTLEPGPVEPVAEKEPSPSEVLRRTVFDDCTWKTTPANQFGLYKKYWTLEARPHDPDSFITSEDLREDEGDNPSLDEGESGEAGTRDDSDKYFPFPNWSSFRLGEWYWDDSQEKGRDSFYKLLDILTSEDFSTKELLAANWDTINDRLGASEFDEGLRGLDWVDDGTSWQTTAVQIDVPFNHTSLHPGVHHYEVPGFRYRPLVPIIEERLKDFNHADHFHIVPSELWWNPDLGSKSGQGVRVYGELYNSPAIIDAYKADLPPEPEESNLPRYVVALMFASDETMLASFGTSKLWPIYMMFGNESKARRGKSSLKLFEEVAYLQIELCSPIHQIPDEFQDWYLRFSGKNNVGNPLSTHLNRELFHAQWKILLDDAFIRAYREGICVDCFDNVRRRFYPRIFTYAADYPEKVMVVGVRSMGDHPCPRCLIALPDIPGMGTPTDMAIRRDQRRKDDNVTKNKINAARKIIQKKHYNVNTDEVELLLKPMSLVPAANTFSDRLSAHGLDVYGLIAVDILHEVEIGVWKSLFIQLLRLLEAVNTSRLNVLNGRFRQMPTFGRDTIRRFRSNVSEMKQLAARDYEDILQCAIPAFEGLIPNEHDKRIQDLLFIFAHWHSLAKLKLHTDTTLSILDNWTVMLGDRSRSFVDQTCSAFETHELKREYLSRKRTEARKKGKIAKSKVTAGSEGPAPEEPDLNTSKFHALGDVPDYIRQYGTTDSYSTQLSERFHRFPKARYRRTNRKQTPHQLSRIQTRQARIRKLKKQLFPPPDEGPCNPERDNASYFIGKSQNLPVSLSYFLRVNVNDPATRDFYPKLRCHLLPRIIKRLLQEALQSPEDYRFALPILKNLDTTGVFSPAHSNGVYLQSDRFYRHKVMQINYTTYDCRRAQDTSNPSTTRHNVMCLRAQSSNSKLEPSSDGDRKIKESGGRFVYGRILGIIHVNIIYAGPGMLDHRPRRFDLLWVRWYDSKDSQFSEATLWSTMRMERVALRPLSDPEACDFIDPSDVVRAAHIIPRFSQNRTFSEEDALQGQIFSKIAKDVEDWQEYYVNPFVDRDMTMRFHWGLAVGH